MTRSHLQIVPHLDTQELTRRYEECLDPRRKNYWFAILLLSHPDTPMTAEEVGEVIGVSTDWIRKLARRYNCHGPAVLMDNWRNQSRLKLFGSELSPAKTGK